jgi:hypothetical protein
VVKLEWKVLLRNRLLVVSEGLPGPLLLSETTKSLAQNQQRFKDERKKKLKSYICGFGETVGNHEADAFVRMVDN